MGLEDGLGAARLPPARFTLGPEGAPLRGGVLYCERSALGLRPNSWRKARVIAEASA